MKLEYLNVSELTPYWRNPRENIKTIDELAKSIIKFGFKVPIIIDKNHVIITGHARQKAVERIIGTLTETQIKLNPELENINKGIVPVIVAEDLTEEQIKEFRISDNKIASLSNWDYDALKFEIRELGNVIGFNDNEIKTLIDEVDYSVEINEIRNEEPEQVKEYLKKETIEQATHYHNNNQARQDDLVKVNCPYCHKELSFSKGLLKAKEQYTGTMDVSYKEG